MVIHMYCRRLRVMRSRGIMRIILIISAVFMLKTLTVGEISAQDPSGKKVPESVDSDLKCITEVSDDSVTVPGRESATAAVEHKEDSTKMDEEKAKKINDAHQFFAIELNNEVWSLLQKTDRTDDENERMIHAAHASCYHWLKVGTGLNHQRGEWLTAHVYTELGFQAEALRHAKMCLALTEKHRDLMQDFDLAYAQEAMARAHALTGNRAEAIRYRETAEKLGNSITGDEDRKIFLGDFDGGSWYGLIK